MGNVKDIVSNSSVTQKRRTQGTKGANTSELLWNPSEGGWHLSEGGVNF